MNCLNIAFDMDGVLRQLDLSMIRLAEAVNTEHAWKALELHILTQTKPILNPGMFAMQEDKLYCITNCSSENSANKKRRWLKHFFADMEIIPVFGPKGAWGDDYYRPVAEAKLVACYDNEINIYIDDCPDIIRYMREMHKEDCDILDCVPFVHFMKYGAWIEEGFE